MDAAATAETDKVIEAPVEFEDIDLSDVEGSVDCEPDGIQLTIDSNCRIVSKGSIACGNDMRFCERESNHTTFHSYGKDLLGDTSSEEIDFSDDGATFSRELKVINLDGMAFAGINQHFDSSSSFNRSSTVFKKNRMTDDDDEINIFEKRSMLPRDDRSKTLASGLTVTSVFASVKDFFSGRPDPNASLSISKPLSDAMFMKSNNPNMESPLMTCVEFLKAEITDDEGTDEEEISMDFWDTNGIHSVCNPTQSNGGTNLLEDVVRCRGKGDFMSFLQNENRRSSWTTELLSDDEYTSEENMTATPSQSKTKKRNSYSNVFKDPDECLTDEEVVDVDEKEWTETDEFGGVRQVTQIKTETSINFEGDGSVLDGDGLVSTTTSTTTRVVTSVISDPEGQSEFQSTFVQQLSDDDIRQSCEITVNEVLNDNSTSKESENDE